MSESKTDNSTSITINNNDNTPLEGIATANSANTSSVTANTNLKNDVQGSVLRQDRLIDRDVNIEMITMKDSDVTESQMLSECHSCYELQKHNKERYLKKKPYLYQNWPGKNILLCGGKGILGSDLRYLVLSIVMTILPTIGFCCFVWPWFFLYQQYYVSIPLIALALLCSIIVLISLCRTAMMDPGIIPRRIIENENERFLTECVKMDANSLAPAQESIPLPPTFETVIINGKPVELKYCYTCAFYRPPRCSHCPKCDNCVDKFDHHCPWTGTCIGIRNYKSYIFFIYITSLICILAEFVIIIQIVLVFLQVFTDDNLANTSGGMIAWNLLKHTLVSFIMMIYLLAVLGFVGALSIMHSYFILTNQTTYESIKRKGKYDHYKGIFRNISEFLFTFPRSRVPMGERMRNLETAEILQDNKKYITELEGQLSADEVHLSMDTSPKSP